MAKKPVKPPRKHNKRDEDFLSPKYRGWRQKVFKRDKFKCKKCGMGGRVNAHHIHRYADNIAMRYELSNGITLCYKCHKAMNKNEEFWAAACGALLSPLTFMDIQYRLYELKQEEDDVSGN